MFWRQRAWPTDKQTMRHPLKSYCSTGLTALVPIGEKVFRNNWLQERARALPRRERETARAYFLNNDRIPLSYEENIKAIRTNRRRQRTPSYLLKCLTGWWVITTTTHLDGALEALAAMALVVIYARLVHSTTEAKPETGRATLTTIFP